VLDALAHGPLSTDALRRRLPPGLVRGLGELGKKHGVSTALPPTLRLLEFDGLVRRVSNAGLDEESYDWALQSGGLYAGVPDEQDALGLMRAIARVFLAHAGPATLDELCWWSGSGKKVATLALAGLQPVEVEGWRREAWILPEQAEALQAATPAGPEEVAFISGYDAYVQVRANLGLLTDPGEHGRVLQEWSPGSARVSEAKSTDTRLVVEGGEVVGQWDWDPDALEVVWGTWRPRGNPAIPLAAGRADAFLRDELGHGRSFALDSPARARERVAGLRGLSRS
jgi:hypothetical protein